jgi:hypothetical protein
MNVATYLMLTVPLVGGSLFLYDSVRSPARPAYDEVGDLRVPPPPRETPKEEAGPMLQADPTAQIERIVRETVGRMLQERGGAGNPGAGTRTEVVEGTDGGAMSLPQMPSIDVPGGSDALDGPNARYDEQTVKVLRSYMDEIQRREREERQVQMVTSQLDRLGVALTDSQRKGVIEATLKYQHSVRDALRAVPPGQENREARTKVMQDVRDQYTKVLYDIAPAAEAEKIVNGLGQGWRGFGGPVDANGNGVGPGDGGRRRTGAGGQGN